MTDDQFGEMYETARAATHTIGILARYDKAIEELADALDQVIEECDARQAGMVDWAIDNGYPAFDTVLSMLGRFVRREKRETRKKKGSPPALGPARIFT